MAKAIRCSQAELNLLEHYRQEMLRTEPVMTVWQKAAMADLLRSALTVAIHLSQKRPTLQQITDEPCNNSDSTVPQLPLFEGPLPALQDNSTPSAEPARAPQSAAKTRKSSNAKPNATPPQSPPLKKRASGMTPGKKNARR